MILTLIRVTFWNKMSKLLVWELGRKIRLWMSAIQEEVLFCAPLKCASQTLPFVVAEPTQTMAPPLDKFANPLVVVETRKAQLTYFDSMVFEMGSEQAAAVERQRMKNWCCASMASFHRNILSGIHIQSGENIVLHKCKFRGGHGAAITVTHEPLFHDTIAIDDEVLRGPARTIELVSCTIQRSGEPWSQCGDLLRHSKDDTTIPGPGAIELWDIRRNESNFSYHAGVTLKGPGPKHTIRLAGNAITNNFRAAIVYRLLEPRSKDKTTKIRVLEANETTSTDSSNDRRLLQVGPYELSFQGNNTIANNGLGTESITSPPDANCLKKAMVVSNDNGEKVLAIQSDAYEPSTWSYADKCIYSELGDLWNEVCEIEKYWW